MASRFDDTNRTVIPSWDDFQTASKAGELLGNNIYSVRDTLFPIAQYISAWKEQQNLAYAGDLLSAAIMNRQTDIPAVQDAALFVLRRENECPVALYKTALSIGQEKPINRLGDFADFSISSKIDRILNRENVIKQRIAFLRKLIHRFQYNPIWYVELSRAYATLGLVDKADGAMSIALHLSPSSRYITRSASRFYMHMGDIDRAHFVITHNPSFKYDPWLLASEIAINASRGRGSRYIKDGLAIINSRNYSPFSISELSSAIGTKELETSRKKGKLLIEKSLIQPNDNSLSQADWLLNIDKSLDFDLSGIIKPEVKYESDARFEFLQGNYEHALVKSIDWIAATPFAKSPINFAAEMAYTYQHRYSDATKILQIGLRCNPNEPVFLNNLAYAYALDNQIEKSDEILVRLQPLVSSDSELKICATATRGLNEYRKGNYEIGSKLYSEAIEDAGRLGKIDLAQKAILNNIREEIRINPHQNIEDISEIISNLSTGNERETAAMKQDILSYISK